MNEELLKFPCEFPIKVMGRAEAGFQELVTELVAEHASPVAGDRIGVRHSRDGNFIALTLPVQVDSREQLDDIYRSLSGHERILMVL
jgi:putative lipoic acid-binding regulatory protein